MEQDKTCTKCGQNKNIDEFGKNGNKNGVQQYYNSCKECTNKIKRSYNHEIGKYKPRVKIEFTETHKICLNCNEWRTFSEFYKGKNKCRKCQNEYRRELKLKNPDYVERQKKATKRWLLSEKGTQYKQSDIHRNYIKTYRTTKKGKETIKKAKFKYRQSDKGKLKEKEYVQKNIERIRYTNKNWQQKYRKSEKYKEWLQSESGRQKIHISNVKRRSFKHKVVFKNHERLEILNRDNWKCQCCGTKVHNRSTGNWNTPDKAHIDHIVPISKGGNSEPDNLQILCRTCNLSKSDKLYINNKI